MQPPQLELDHDGFRASFGAPQLATRLFEAGTVGLIALTVALALWGVGGLPIVGTLLAASVSAMIASELRRPWVLEARQGHLRLGRSGGRQHALDPGALKVRVVIRPTKAAGPDGSLRKLLLVTPQRTYELPATQWPEAELVAFAELVDAIEPNAALPAPPPALLALTQT